MKKGLLIILTILSLNAFAQAFESFNFTGLATANGWTAHSGTTGAITAQTLNVQQVTSSIVYSSGSNIFGNSVSNTQSMTGSVGISGSLAVTGASTITDVLTLNSTISNGTYTYTLPSATGTLALTSALSSYLPLSGGTLTGALSGTSATFTSGTTGPSTGITSIGDITAARTSTTGAIFLGTTGSKYLYYDGTKYILNASPLEVGGSITATSATFSSRVNVNGATDNSSYVIQGKGNVSSIDSNNQNTVFLAASPTASYLATSWIGGGGAVPLYIQNNGINALTISTTGAATFTGDVAISNTTSNKLTISGGSTQNGITLSAITGFGNNFYIFNGDGGLGN